MKSKQHLEKSLIEFKEMVLGELNEEFSRGDDILRYQWRLCVPKVDGLRDRILEKAHGPRYSIYPGSTKIYHDLRKYFGGKI